MTKEKIRKRLRKTKILTSKPTGKYTKIVEGFREMAKKHGLPANKIIIGDALYEEGM